jgi:hypothetical protein
MGGFRLKLRFIVDRPFVCIVGIMANGLSSAATHKRKDANLDVYQGSESTFVSVAGLANDCKTKYS